MIASRAAINNITIIRLIGFIMGIITDVTAIFRRPS